MMEHISLVSMNGHMTYPQIKKKMKEVGLNVACFGYFSNNLTIFCKLVPLGSVVSFFRAKSKGVRSKLLRISQLTSMPPSGVT